jgi:hypothetical protein
MILKKAGGIHMRKRVFVFVAFFIVTSFLLSFAEQTTLKMEAEDTEGKYVVVEAQEASAGKYIGIDHTLDENNENNYYLIFKDMPATTAIKMVYGTGSVVGGEVKIYILEGEQEKEVGALAFESTGGWDPFGESMLVSVAEDLTIEEGSTIVMKATMSVNIDYFEFVVAESTNPKTSDTLEMIAASVMVVSCLVVFRKKHPLACIAR